MQVTSGVSGTVVPAFTHGLTIFLLIVGLGHISGGHFNPAVTLGVLISGNINFFRAILYIVFQLTGGCLGALLIRAVTNNSTASEGNSYENVMRNGSLTFPGTDVNVFQASICEAVFTFLLVLTVLLAAIESKGTNLFAAQAIGTCVIVDILAGGMLTGASMNPARSFGPAVAYTIFGQEPHFFAWRAHYVYWIGPAVGSCLAAVIYKCLLAESKNRWCSRYKYEVNSLDQKL